MNQGSGTDERADGPEPSPAAIRNLGVVAHINAGKTTLTERILFDSGRQRWMGEVDHGTAAMDWMAEEQRRGISITAAATRFEWAGHTLNLVDTPGHVDFAGEVGRCLRVLDGVVVVLDGVRGVESQTETVWHQADAWALPRLVFINKLDRQTADYPGVLASLRERLDARPLPIFVPLGPAGALTPGEPWLALFDVVRGEVHGREGAAEPLPTLDPDWIARQREDLVDAVSEWYEPALTAYVQGDGVGDELLRAGIRAGCIAGHCVPVLAGSALENVGVRKLLDSVCAYLPGPEDARDVRVRARQLAPHDAPEPPPDPEGPLCALVFKVQSLRGEWIQRTGAVANHGTSDPGLEKFYFVRVFSGILRPGQVLMCSSRSLQVPIAELSALHAEERIAVDCARPGDIVALTTPAELRTGDTIHAADAPRQLERVVFPRPVLEARMEPLTAAQQGALESGAAALAAEDPTLEVQSEEAGGIVVGGMGELHLEIARERLERALGSPVRMGRPAVARVETVRDAAGGTIQVRGMVGGRECFARAEVEIRPAPGRGPGTLIPTRPEGPPDLPWDDLATELAASLVAGVHAPHPTVDLDLRVIALGGDAPLPQGAGLYAQALALAVRRAMVAARPVLLEPEVRVDVVCPAGVLASVLRDLKSQGVELDAVASGMLGGKASGRAPLSRLLGYATRLRSVSKGQAVMALAPLGYVPTPDGDSGPRPR